MNYIEAFKNLKTNNKYGRKSPHKAVLMLTVIEQYEQNLLSDNEIYYDDNLKSMFVNMWNRVLPDEPLFHPEAFFPFWYLQSDSFWHIVPVRGKEDILSLMRDTNIKPSEAKLKDCVRYAELDDDLYFLMTLPSGRSSLKRALLETYTNLSEKQIDRLAKSVDNTIDYSVSALSDYENILYNEKDINNIASMDIDSELVRQFQSLNEDIQIVLNLQYFSFLKSHRNERGMFREICPSVYVLLDKIVTHPIKQGELVPSFAFTYDNFLSDLKIALMSEDGAMELIEKIENAIDLLRGNNNDNNEYISPINEPLVEEVVEQQIETSSYEQEEFEDRLEREQVDDIDDLEIEQVVLDSKGKVLYTVQPTSKNVPPKVQETESRKGKAWTKEEEEQIENLFQQGKDFNTIATITGRTEIAIKLRLAKLGLIEYSYGQEDYSSSPDSKEVKEKSDESDYNIRNSNTGCAILNKSGEIVFRADGKLKFIGDKLYRFNLKKECFTVKNMLFDGNVWLKWKKVIVAYPQTDLYRKMYDSIDICDDIEDIVFSYVFEDCKIKVNGEWYKNNGELVNRLDSQDQKLYAVKRKAIMRAMSLFRHSATIKEISRTISRTAWGSTINEKEVESIINTMNEIGFYDGKYYLRKNR